MIAWECPDFFPYKMVLILSPIEDSKKILELKFDGYLIGDMNWETGRFMLIPMDEMDGGFLDLCPSNPVKNQMANDTWLPDANVAPVYPRHRFTHGRAGSMTPLKDAGQIGSWELPESVNEHFFFVEHASGNHCWGKSDHDPSERKQTLFELDTKPGRSFILGYGDETDPDSVSAIGLLKTL